MLEITGGNLATTRHSGRVKKYLPLYALAAPALLTMLFWFYLPVLNSLRMSLFRWDGFMDARYIGLTNFREIFADKYFWLSMRNMGLMLAFWFTVPFAMPFVAAELICGLKRIRARRFYRTVFLLPTVVPVVVAVLLWRYIYDYKGLLNIVLHGLHLSGLAHDWLNEPSLALLAVMMVGFPFAGGTALLIFTAGLEGIPMDINDSARMDGVSVLKRLWYVDIPYCLPQFRFMTVTNVGGILANYVVVMLLTQGGPLFRTIVPGYYLYDKAFGNQLYGYACAVGVLLVTLILVLTFVAHRFLRTDTEYYTS